MYYLCHPFCAMEKFRYYNVSFAGLSLGKHDFEFHVTQPFFDLFEFEQDFRNPSLKVQLILDKKNNFLELGFNLSGTVELDCDLTNEPYNQELNGKSEIIVKFGEEFDDSDDEIWVIPHGEHSVNIAQMMYEMTLLAIPVKRIHPDVQNGKSDSEMLDLLNLYSLGEDDDENSDNEETDPRWEELKKLKNNNN